MTSFPKPLAIVGQVKIDVAQKRHRADFETASWWQDELSDTGVYDVALVLNDKGTGLYLQALVPGTVVDAFFPSSFGGNMIGKYDKTRDVGRPVVMRFTMSVIEAIDSYGYTPNREMNWVFRPEFWDTVEKLAEEQLAHHIERMPYWVAEYAKGDDVYHSRLGMVGACGGWIKEQADALGVIRRKKDTLARFRGYDENNTNFGPSVRPLLIVDTRFNSFTYKCLELGRENQSPNSSPVEQCTA